MSDGTGRKSTTPLVHRKIKRHTEEESHGVWKIAYADFATAMMAFFLLMWLVNITDDEQKKTISELYNPYIKEDPETPHVDRGVMSIFDGGMMGGTSLDERDPESSRAVLEADLGGIHADDLERWREDLEIFEEETEALRRIRERIYRILESVPELKSLSENIRIEEAPDGLRIQILDRDGFSMFSLGSSRITPRAHVLLTAIGTILADTPNHIAVSGHTDGVPYKGQARYSNWELSADRANAARRELVEAGVGAGSIDRVEGLADTRHLIEEDPRDPRNRRISILLLREHMISPALEQAIGSLR